MLYASVYNFAWVIFMTQDIDLVAV